MTVKYQSPKMSPASKLAMKVQAFMLRRNWMGPMGDFVGVITTTGRRTGRSVSTPIGYVIDGDYFVATTNGKGTMRSNWYQNVLAKPAAVLTIKGQDTPVTVEFLNGADERKYAIQQFRQKRGDRFKSFFGVEATAPDSEIEQAVSGRVFVRFKKAGRP